MTRIESKLDDVQLSVELLGDGVHVRWFAGLRSVNDPNRRHEIIIQVDDSGQPTNVAHIRLMAFASTLLAEARLYSPKTYQKKFEKQYEKNPSMVPDAQKNYDKVLITIENAFKQRDINNLKFAQDGLRRAVITAHKLMSTDDVEQIVREALVEHVLKS